MSIEVRNLKYTYNPGMPGETLALDDVSFEVRDGETIGIIGHTGSGKSTLLQHLNGLIKPDSGSVYIDGQCITDGSTKLTEIRRKVGLVFQYPEYQLFEETVAKDVAFGPRNTGLPEDQIETRVRAAMSIVGLDYDEIGETSPFELSGGQKRRVAIAGVVAMRPSVLILDEPTAGLDPAAHNEILSMIETINSSMNMIIIFVSHNMADVAKLSDRVLVMDKGKIAMQGTPREVFSHEDELSSMGLGVPPVRDILRQIREAVPEFESDALTAEEAAEDIRRYFGLE
jgi:energy-coupling factor transport system ATP-binding protein